MACLDDTTAHLKGELDYEQKLIDNLPDNLKACSLSVIEERQKIFLLTEQ